MLVWFSLFHAHEMKDLTLLCTIVWHSIISKWKYDQVDRQEGRAYFPCFLGEIIKYTKSNLFVLRDVSTKKLINCCFCNSKTLLEYRWIRMIDSSLRFSLKVTYSLLLAHMCFGSLESLILWHVYSLYIFSTQEG